MENIDTVIEWLKAIRSVVGRGYPLDCYIHISKAIEILEKYRNESTLEK